MKRGERLERAGRSVRDRLEDARRAARALLQGFGVEAPEHIEIESMARALGATVIDDPGLVTSDARIVRTGRHAVIRLSTRVAHAGRRRFSLAHELGHLVLENGGDALNLSCSAATNPLAVAREAEANAFAAELLMPAALARPSCEVSPVTLDVAGAIAATFQTSIVASAVRLAELTSERCAAVYSERSEIRWSARSATFRPFIEKGTPLDPASVAYDVARGCRRYANHAQPIAAEAWIETSGRDGDLIEHSVAVPETGGVLSLLWIPDAEARRLGVVDDD